MKKINIENWKEFRVGDLFDIHPTKNYNMINSKLFERIGSVPVVVNSSFNNGIGGYVDLEPTENGEIITFSDTTSSTAIFYQPKDFVGYSHVQGMYPKNERWTENSLLFFLVAFKKAAFLQGFDYVNKFTRELASNLTIKLPVLENNIDFEYMETYIENMQYKTVEYFNKLNKIDSIEKRKIETKEWKNYRLGDLFDINSPKVYHTKDVKENIEGIPYIVRSKYNNGMKYRVSMDEKFVLNPANTISFGAENATFFYQKEKYISGRDMYYIDTRKISEKAAFFLISCLQTITERYSYNYGLFPKLLREEIIKLPMDNNGNPDWDYMEDYISKLPYGNLL